MATSPVITIRGQINSRYEMRRAGYKFSGASKCKACNAAVEWWLTNHGRKVCFNPIASDEIQTETHRLTCSGSGSKPSPRGPDQTPKSYTAVPPAAETKIAMQRDVQTLCGKYQLRAALLLHEGGEVHCYRLDIAPEDLRSEIITAANKVRDDAMKTGR